jgi:hypothetical protein
MEAKTEERLKRKEVETVQYGYWQGNEVREMHFNKLSAI